MSSFIVWITVLDDLYPGTRTRGTSWLDVPRVRVRRGDGDRDQETCDETATDLRVASSVVAIPW